VLNKSNRGKNRSRFLLHTHSNRRKRTLNYLTDFLRQCRCSRLSQRMLYRSPCSSVCRKSCRFLRTSRMLPKCKQQVLSPLWYHSALPRSKTGRRQPNHRNNMRTHHSRSSKGLLHNHQRNCQGSAQKYQRTTKPMFLCYHILIEDCRSASEASTGRDLSLKDPSCLHLHR